MRTLVVHYTPRKESSVTRKLLDAFLEGLSGSDLDQRDLCTDPPAPLNALSTEAYYARNMFGSELNDEQRHSLQQMDECTAQLKAADIVVVAFPMFNFSVPAAVKAWFDLILQVGETIRPGDGKYAGLMGGRRAVILSASGGVYSDGNGEGPMFGPAWDHAVTLARQLFSFMGYSEVHSVLAEGTALPDSPVGQSRALAALAKARMIAASLYGPARLR